MPSGIRSQCAARVIAALNNGKGPARGMDVISTSIPANEALSTTGNTSEWDVRSRAG